MIALTDEDLKAAAEAIETADDNAAVWLSYVDGKLKVEIVPPTETHWRLDKLWQYCFMGYAWELRKKLAMENKNE